MLNTKKLFVLAYAAKKFPIGIYMSRSYSDVHLNASHIQIRVFDSRQPHDGSVMTHCVYAKARCRKRQQWKSKICALKKQYQAVSHKPRNLHMCYIVRIFPAQLMFSPSTGEVSGRLSCPLWSAVSYFSNRILSVFRDRG